MAESAVETGADACIPYGLLISHILVDSLLDLSAHKPIDVSATYDSHDFASMGYVLFDSKWQKKG